MQTSVLLEALLSLPSTPNTNHPASQIVGLISEKYGIGTWTFILVQIPCTLNSLKLHSKHNAAAQPQAPS